MVIDQERILHHANERLPSVSKLTRSGQIEAAKRFLKLESQRLRMRHRFGLSGEEIAAGRCYQVDLVVRRACRWIAEEFPTHDQPQLANCSLVALGGYGRGELAPFSDVDILFLRPDCASKVVQEFVEQVLMLLWDAGLTVGHSYRTVDECVAIARKDVHSRTAMAEARLIIGHKERFARLMRRLDESIFRNVRENAAFLAALRQEIEARHARYGRGVGLLEPNVKESPGGLRDLHSALWLSHARFGHRRIEELHALGQVSDKEYIDVRRAYGYVSRVRNQMHFTTGRRSDLLLLDLQPEIADALGYRPRRGHSASEVFMRDYYRRASELHRLCETFLVRTSSEPTRRRLAIPILRRRRGGLFEVRGGWIKLGQGDVGFANNPRRMLEAFDLAQEHNVDLDEKLKLAVRHSLWAIDDEFRVSAEASAIFRRILGRRGRVGATIRAMHETGFLGRFLPEFGRIVFLPQHDLYHSYTVDEHTLRTVEALDRAARGEGTALLPFRKVLSEVRDTAALYLGALFHDVGKGRGGGHALIGARAASRVGRRLRLDEGVTENAAFLVRHHLAMSRISQRRDISEETLTADFAETVGNLERLNMLMLLTYADLTAIGPGVFTEWKAALLWELYNHVRAHLSGKSPIRWDEDRRTRARARIEQALCEEFPRSQVERHLAMLPDKYLKTTTAERVAEHLRLIARLASATMAAEWRVNHHGCTELTLCAADERGALARLAGTLSVNDLDILSVDVYTREDGIIIDTFRLKDLRGRPIGEARLRKIENDLEAAIRGRLDVAAAVEQWLRSQGVRRREQPARSLRPSVRFDSEASATSTVIEVRTQDEPGLVYRITSSLTALGLDIDFAKIGSEKNHALDVFYVTNDADEKPSVGQMSVIEEVLLDALGSEGQRFRKEGYG